MKWKDVFSCLSVLNGFTASLLMLRGDFKGALVCILVAINLALLTIAWSKGEE